MTAQHPASILLCFASSRSPPSFLVPFSFLRNPLLRSSPPSSLLSSRLSLPRCLGLSCASSLFVRRQPAARERVLLSSRRNPLPPPSRANVPHLSSFIIVFLGLSLLSFIKSRGSRAVLSRAPCVASERVFPRDELDYPACAYLGHFSFVTFLIPYPSTLRNIQRRRPTVIGSRRVSVRFSFALSISLFRYISLIDFLSAISEASRWRN